MGRKEIDDINIESRDKTAPSPMGVMDPSEVADCVGCTSCMALITKTEIIVANAGDSRCVLSKNGIAINMSEDHKPELDTERKRIEKAEGYVNENRVNGVLGLSRALGDLDYKKNKRLGATEQMVTASPDLKVEKIANDTDFLIIACDGIWDCMSSQGAVDFIKERVAKANFKRDKSFKFSSAVGEMMDSIIAKDIDSSGKNYIRIL